MKQHITVDQLLSLTPEQQAKLREWWVPEVGDAIAGWWLNEEDDMALVPLGFVLKIDDDHLDTGGDIIWYKGNCLPLLSIGQCLELLCSKGVATIEARPAVGFSMHIKVPVDAWGKESIDALFAAVKEVV